MIYRCIIAVTLLATAGCSSSPAPVEGGATVVSTTPTNNATGVAPDVSIEIVFDKPIDPMTLIDGIELSPARSFSVTWDITALTATVRPQVALAADVAYHLAVATTVTTLANEPLKQRHEVDFTVRAATTCAAVSTTTVSRGDDTATVQVSADALRSYTLQSTATLRDGLPAGNEVVFAEQQDQMLLRSGHDMFDALFAMALEETRQNSVAEIRDGGFSGGNAVPCECFETGEKWTYVWTRDTAYAAHLGLALVDPSRARRSLEFKLSERKADSGGADRQIVQDTGTGGSYPVSTDRVVWAHGAREVLAFLDGAEHDAFRDLAYEAAVNTIEQDRRLVFDDRDGLYRGEQSFLDWREQSYPTWVALDLSHVAMSKSLSTNVGHLALLRLARDLAAEKGDSAAEARYTGFAGTLANSIRATLLAAPTSPHGMLVTELAAPLTEHRDLLGESLAILGGLFAGGAAVASYPRSAFGSPVFWPQLPDVPIYHNRGMWPFVSAYSLLAARTTRNAEVFAFELDSLAHSAALNLSNMENYDFANGANFTDAGSASGPVVNSRRQLWSVAGYLAVVTKGLFGLEATAEGIRFRPAMTGRIRRDWFGSQQRISLRNVPYKGRLIDVQLILPDCTTGNDWLETDAVWLDGIAIGNRFVTTNMIGDRATVTVALRTATAPAGTITLVDTSDSSQYIAPREPAITGVAIAGDHLAVTIDAQGETNVTFDLWRDGEWVAQDTANTVIQDDEATDFATRTRCYVARIRRGELFSHFSRPVCYWGDNFERVTEVDAAAFVATGGTFSMANGRPHYQDWGDPDHTLELANMQPGQTGDHYIQLIYANGAGVLNTGITAASKWIEVRDTADDSVVGAGLIVMPQRGDWTTWTESTLLRVSLDEGKTYRIVIRDSTNMSYFEHFVRYDNTGGGNASFNRVDIAALRLMAL